ncbi:hypothetical protein PFRI_18450 [Planktotalea frisia]|jgi:hypothetical protein|uniref:Uncharacterized protein n=1 Tax=Planktotalea frisia TaxID=696762 RepID=A0A1L9NXQ9_9RHOB|nr:hypothetical protein PFRI_18450 [Planktotalea frisia]
MTVIKDDLSDLPHRLPEQTRGSEKIIEAVRGWFDGR